MSYIIYHKETTRLLDQNKTYKTITAAKSALTRISKKNHTINKSEYEITDINNFTNNIEKSIERTNLQTKQKYMEKINTPPYMSPAYESYWSM